MDIENVKRLISGIKLQYGRDDLQMDLDTWAGLLAPFDTEQVKYAVGALREHYSRFPPNAMEFANLCEKLPRKDVNDPTCCGVFGCPIKCHTVRCELHAVAMTDAENNAITRGISRNPELVSYYLFLQHARLIEILNPEIWGWPEFALKGWRGNPPVEGELPNDYRLRISYQTKIACDVDPKYLTVESDKKPSKSRRYQPSKQTFASASAIISKSGAQR